VSNYPDMAARTAPARPARRPGTLTTAIVFTVLAGVAAIFNGVLIITGGRELIKELLTSSAGLPEGSFTEEDLSQLGELAGVSLDDLEATMSTRAYLVLASGVGLVLFGLAMYQAAKWARILVTLSAVGAMLFSLVIVADVTNSTMAILCLAAILGGLVAVVLTWLPANGRYAKALT
jgi:hypothetical protein